MTAPTTSPVFVTIISDRGQLAHWHSAAQIDSRLFDDVRVHAVAVGGSDGSLVVTLAVNPGFYAIVSDGVNKDPVEIGCALATDLTYRAIEIIDVAENRNIVLSCPLSHEALAPEAVRVSWSVAAAAEMIVYADDPELMAAGITLKRLSAIKKGSVRFAVIAPAHIIEAAHDDLASGGFGGFADALAHRLYLIANPEPSITPEQLPAQIDDEPIPF